jgi:hypothetical protein|tara:strand:+ start:584 stop:1777 length:1194 start_codon:yes stop_codon:yes gene_type:complete
MSAYKFPIEDLTWRKNCVGVACFNCSKLFAVRKAHYEKNNNLYCTKKCHSGEGCKTKRCTKCKEVKDKKDFPKATHTKSGVYSHCRICSNATTRSAYKKSKKNPDKYIKVCAIEGCNNKTPMSHPRCGMHQNIGTNRDKGELKNFYEGKQVQYADKIIDYPESPTGKAYIGIAKKPLMESETGYGFEGVLIQTDDRMLVQCHNCGEWRKHLSLHVKSCTGLTAKEYKRKYGLLMRTGLLSDAQSMENTKNLFNQTVGFRDWNKNPKNAKRRMEQNAKGRALAVARKKKGGVSAEQMNRTGTCPLQIKTRVIEFIHANKEFPTASNRGQSLYQIIAKRFGSFKDGMREYGLPQWIKGTYGERYYEFPDGSIHSFNSRDIQERDMFYQLMVQKCPVLTN